MLKNVMIITPEQINSKYDIKTYINFTECTIVSPTNNQCCVYNFELFNEMRDDDLIEFIVYDNYDILKLIDESILEGNVSIVTDHDEIVLTILVMYLVYKQCSLNYALETVKLSFEQKLKMTYIDTINYVYEELMTPILMCPITCPIEI